MKFTHKNSRATHRNLEDLPQLDYTFDHKDIIKEYLVEKDFE